MTIIYQITLYKNNKMSYDVDEVIKENVEIDNEFVKDMVWRIINMSGLKLNLLSGILMVLIQNLNLVYLLNQVIY